jgi:hypothetical protein
MSMAQTGPAMTLFNVQRQAGQAMGVAVLAATRPVLPDLGGYHLAFVVAALVMVSGSIVASRVMDAEAAATMAPAAGSESAAAASG